MALVEGSPRVVGTANETAVESLRVMLAHSYDNFQFYRDRFDAANIARHDIESHGPLDTLRRLPWLESANLGALADEAIAKSDGIIDIETSSGTTGRRKIRYISYDDDLRDHQLLAQMFAIAGVGPNDRVACLDTDPVNLMVSIARAFDLLGAAEAYCLSVGADPGAIVEIIDSLAPTVLCSVPSIIQRYLSIRSSTDAGAESLPFSKVVFIGESMPTDTRRTLEKASVEVFGYYGASETSALGIECKAHQGIHLMASAHMMELLPLPNAPEMGETVVTTLHQFAQPLLRYRLGDRVQVLAGECPCGVPSPRLAVYGKPDETVSMLGSKIGFGALREAAYSHEVELGPLQLIVSRTTVEVLELLLPDTIRRNEVEILESVLSAEPDLRFLRDGGFMDLQVSFVEPGHFTSERKLRPILDHRA